MCHGKTHEQNAHAQHEQAVVAAGKPLGDVRDESADDVRISPDGNWVLAHIMNQLYVTAMPVVVRAIPPGVVTRLSCRAALSASGSTPCQRPSSDGIGTQSGSPVNGSA